MCNKTIKMRALYPRHGHWGDVRNIAIELNLGRFVNIHERVLALCQLVAETLLVWLHTKLVERSDEADWMRGTSLDQYLLYAFR